MIPSFLAAQLVKKRRANRAMGARKREREGSSQQSSRRSSLSNHHQSYRDENQVDKMALLRRYGSLLKTTVISFILSTAIHIGIVLGYYYIYLYLNPDDPGKKKFYATTTTNPGVKIGNRMVGGGGVHTNHHKSYLLHLVREHYKSMSKLFFVQFSLIYLLILFLFKFFPEREKLRVDTITAFKLSSNDQDESELSRDNGERQSSRPKKASRDVLLKKRNLAKAKKEKENENDDEDYTDEEILEEDDMNMTDIGVEGVNNQPVLDIKKDN